jgi:hypothetical protein
MSANNSRQSVATVPRKSYTTVGFFGFDLFKYDYGLNPQTLVEQGVLTPLGNNADCPPGRILYENGKRIVPTSSPFPPIMVYHSIPYGNAPLIPLTSYMVGVFDPKSGLSGFIDPNSVNFAINSTDLPVFMNNDIGNAPNGIKNSGNPVITNGNVLSLIQPFDSTVAAPLPQHVGIATAGVDYIEGSIFDDAHALATYVGNPDNNHSLGFITGEGANRNTQNWAGMFANGNIYSTGNLFVKRAVGTVTLVAGVATAANVNRDSDTVPLVFLTYKGNTGTANRGILSYDFTASGGDGNSNDLRIQSTNSSDTSQVNWFMIHPFPTIAP